VLARALVAELAAESKRAGGDSAIRAMVITGSGTRAFCAGANLKERRGWTDDDIRRWLVELHTALREIERCPKPWIAAVNGLALGGGCELALACDLRIVDPAAQMGLTETRIGIIPGGGGTVRLPRLVGLGRARDMILTARRVPADEALRIGLADRGSATFCSSLLGLAPSKRPTKTNSLSGSRNGSASGNLPSTLRPVGFITFSAKWCSSWNLNRLYLDSMIPMS